MHSTSASKMLQQGNKYQNSIVNKKFLNKHSSTHLSSKFLLKQGNWAANDYPLKSKARRNQKKLKIKRNRREIDYISQDWYAFWQIETKTYEMYDKQDKFTMDLYQDQKPFPNYKHQPIQYQPVHVFKKRTFKATKKCGSNKRGKIFSHRLLKNIISNQLSIPSKKIKIFNIIQDVTISIGCHTNVIFLCSKSKNLQKFNDFFSFSATCSISYLCLDFLSNHTLPYDVLKSCMKYTQDISDYNCYQSRMNKFRFVVFRKFKQYISKLNSGTYHIYMCKLLTNTININAKNSSHPVPIKLEHILPICGIQFTYIKPINIPWNSGRILQKFEPGCKYPKHIRRKQIKKQWLSDTALGRALTCYHIYDDGNIKRRKLKCNVCGVYMANHYDRLYCGKCHSTFLRDRSCSLTLFGTECLLTDFNLFS